MACGKGSGEFADQREGAVFRLTHNSSVVGNAAGNSEDFAAGTVAYASGTLRGKKIRTERHRMIDERSVKPEGTAPRRLT